MSEEWEKDKSCLLCTHGHFINYGSYPQEVECEIHGVVKERASCEDCKHEPIQFVDPFNLTSR